MKVRLLYFKETGKYYAEGQYDTLLKRTEDIVAEVRAMFASNIAPGLLGMNNTFFALVEAVDLGSAFLIKPESWRAPAIITASEREKLIRGITNEESLDIIERMFNAINALSEKVAETEQRITDTETAD